MTLKLGIQTYQILTNDDEVGIPSLSSILLAVLEKKGTLRVASLILSFNRIYNSNGILKDISNGLENPETSAKLSNYTEIQETTQS